MLDNFRTLISAILAKVSAIYPKKSDVYTKTEMDNKISKLKIPTNVSQLNNDSGYVTTDDIPIDVSQLNNDAGYVTAEDIPETDSAQAIVDVIELPTENIQENTFYRLQKAQFINNDELITHTTCHIVNSLPEVGEVVTDIEMSYIIAYYSVADNEVYGYMDEALSSAFSVSAGWYPFSALASIAELAWGGIITDINDDPSDGVVRLLISYDYYTYKNEWVKTVFAYEKTPAFDIQWDGVIGDRFTLDLTPMGFANTSFVKISDEVFTAEMLIGATYNQTQGYEHVIGTYSFDTDTYPGALNVDGGITIVYSEKDINAAFGLPDGHITNGTYFVYFFDEEYPDGLNYTNRLVAATKITKIDKKYLDYDYMDINEENSSLHYVAFSGDYNSLYNRPNIYTDVIRYNTTQNLASTYKAKARANIDVYSKSEVDTKIANSGTSVDLSDYAKTADLAAYAKTSDVYSKSEVDTKIANNKPNIDLTQYAKLTDLNSYAKTSELSDYAKTSEIENMIAEAISGAIGGSY